jgi:membrane associated rhomboid family serine protease
LIKIDVLDLNHIFLFIAVVSPLLVLARAWHPSGAYRGWRFSALVVLAVTGIAWICFRDLAGYIGGGLWFALLFVPAVGLRKVTELTTHQRYKSARRLAKLLQILHPTAELREQVQVLRTLESRRSEAVAFHPWVQPAITRPHRQWRLSNAPAVLILILMNVAAFLSEISFGNLSDPETLHRLGALEPYAVVVRGEHWRLFTALFLHGGWAHLGFNLFALYVLGPPLERVIGTIRFAACYLISGLGSSAGVVLLTILGLVHVGQLVGASGCVMGIVGAWAGFLLRHRHAPRAKQRLGNIVMIVLIQIAFDLSTPQVSMAAHLCGLISGFVLGLILAPRWGTQG